MKCYAKSVIDAKAERVSEAVWQHTMECIIDEECIMAIAVKRYFGFGQKRLNQFLDFLEEVKAEFETYDKDGIFRDKIHEELMSINVDMRDMYENIEKWDHAKKRFTRMDKKPQVSEVEAMRIQNTMKAFKRMETERMINDAGFKDR